jgi:phospholipid/cholesterol/gamma-HCH transport system permease protein
MAVLQDVTGWFSAFVKTVGGIFMLHVRTFAALPTAIPRVGLLLRQAYLMGVRSFPLVAIVSVFVGGVTAVQASFQLPEYVPISLIGNAVGKSVVIELGPVITALVVAGRVGASLAAEIGTMKVTEQIDAMETMALNPIVHLVVPRYLGMLIMLPILVVYSNVIAIGAATIIADIAIGLPTPIFLAGVKQLVYVSDVWISMLKATVFGSIIGIVGCYYGFRASGGAEGVGRATTDAVVLAMVMILVSDFVLATLLYT